MNFLEFDRVTDMSLISPFYWDTVHISENHWHYDFFWKSDSNSRLISTWNSLANHVAAAEVTNIFKHCSDILSSDLIKM